MDTIRRIKVFLSSPSDVLAERDAVEKIIDEINKHEGNKDKYYVYVYRWETGHTPDWGLYQPKINKEIENADIFVGILWNRFGSPTDKFLSGTEEEFNEACALKEQGQNIELCFYRCLKKGVFDENNQQEVRQKLSVNEFFDKFNNKKYGFSAKLYSDFEKFKSEFRQDILTKINGILEDKNNIILDNQYFIKNGITKIYTPEMNEIRNKDKIDFLKREEDNIFLLAHSGNSYLHTSEDGNPGRFFNDLKRRLLTKTYKLFVILLNPYSLEARKIFYAENFDIYKNDITGIKSTDILKRGKNYIRFSDCIKGINEIRRELGTDKDRIEVRISNVATDGTILMSNRRLFFEPYISSRFLNRIEQGLNIFELQIINLLNLKQCSSIFNKRLCQECDDKNVCSENLYKTLSEQFHILWESSIPLKEYNNQVHKYEDDFVKTQPDLFNKQITQLHDSWYAFDPIIGCNGNCVYCFLSPQGWDSSEPVLRKRSNEVDGKFLENAYNSLNEYKYYKLANSGINKNNLLGEIPISIGNKTDMLAPINRENLISILNLHQKGNTKRPIVLITKQAIDVDFIDELCKYNFDINIMYSISFLPKKFEPNVPHYKKRIQSAKLIRNKIKDENIKNIHLIHYWRPIIKLFEEDICHLIEQIQPIFECSVCVGLKLNSEIRDFIKNDCDDKDKDFYNYLISRGGEDSIEIFEPSFLELKEIVGRYSYPIFQHTSCALSFVQGKVDYNGSMWRENFCNDCVLEQKEKCLAFKKKWDSNNCVNILKRYIDQNFSLKEDCIEIINLSITQEKINYFTHLLGKPVYSESTRFSLVWPSSNQIYYLNKYTMNKDSKKNYFEIFKLEYPELVQQLERLKDITGFVSVLGLDKRVKVFNRYNHVVRVHRLLNWYIQDMSGLDFKKCVFIALFHDINRLPFAHNLEKHIGFSQANTFPTYISLFNSEIPENYYKEFNAFYDKKLDYSAESRIVYFIDVVEGFIEDPLFAFATLGINYQTISQEVLSMLCFDNKELLELNINKLKKLFIENPIDFTNEFDIIVFHYAKAFINKHLFDKYKMFDDSHFMKIKDEIKNQLMVRQIFPVNNEQVSKGKYLAEKIGIPYIEYLKTKGADPYKVLFTQTDNDLLLAAISLGIISEEEKESFYPALPM